MTAGSSHTIKIQARNTSGISRALYEWNRICGMESGTMSTVEYDITTEVDCRNRIRDFDFEYSRGGSYDTEERRLAGPATGDREGVL